MAEFQVVLGIILLVVAIVLIALAIYNLVIVSRITTSKDSIKSTISEGEKRGALALNVIIILIGAVLGVYGVVLLVPERKKAATAPAMRGSRSLSGAVLTPTGQYA